MNSRIERITHVLQALKPTHLIIHDDSDKHAGHAAMKGITGAETHLRIEIAAESLNGLSRIEQHRKVQALCQSEMDKGLHALQIKILA